MSARRYDEAIADFDRAIANGGWHPTMSGLKARALEASNRNSEALAESKRFLGGAFDAFSFRSMAKDAFKRVAYMESNLSQYDAAVANFQMAAAYEDNKPERIRLLMDAGDGGDARLHRDAGALRRVPGSPLHCFGEAASATGTLDWGEYDHNKLVELGVQVGRAAPNRAALLFDRLIDTIRDSPSAGAYSLVYGVGKVVVEQLQNAQKSDEADKQQGRLSEMQRVLTALAPRGMFKT